MALPSPKPGFAKHLQQVVVPVGALLRLSRFPKTEPYWSPGRYRFDGPAGGTCRSTYAADALETAFCETVIHEHAYFDGIAYLVAEDAARSRHVVRFERPTKPQLLLADFRGEPLKALGLNNDISAGDDYAVPQAWAQAVHDVDMKWDGIAYVSRQRNQNTAVALFERSGVAKASARKLTAAQLSRLCDRFNVTLAS